MTTHTLKTHMEVDELEVPKDFHDIEDQVEWDVDQLLPHLPHVQATHVQEIEDDDDATHEYLGQLWPEGVNVKDSPMSEWRRVLIQRNKVQTLKGKNHLKEFADIQSEYCNCKKGACDNNRCVCKKVNRKCTNECHKKVSNHPCKNKT